MQLTVIKGINPYGFPNIWSTALKYNGVMSCNVIVRPVHRILIDHKRWLIYSYSLQVVHAFISVSMSYEPLNIKIFSYNLQFL